MWCFKERYILLKIKNWIIVYLCLMIIGFWLNFDIDAKPVLTMSNNSLVQESKKTGKDKKNEQSDSTKEKNINIPIEIEELKKNKDTGNFLKKLVDLKKSGKIAIGDSIDFVGSKKCKLFVVVADDIKIVDIFYFGQNKFISIYSFNELSNLQSESLVGKRQIWIQYYIN